MFEGKPAVVPLSSAWKYSQMAFADPQVVANQVRQFAIGMNKDSLAQVIALTDLINDCLSDLISMPPDPRERLVKRVWRIYSSTVKNGMTAKVAGKTSQDTTFIQKQQTHLGSLLKVINSDSKLNKINRGRYRGKWFNPCLC